MSNSIRLVSALVLALGVAAGGYFADEGLLKERQLDRIVSTLEYYLAD